MIMSAWHAGDKPRLPDYIRPLPDSAQSVFASHRVAGLRCTALVNDDKKFSLDFRRVRFELARHRAETPIGGDSAVNQIMR